MQIQHHFAKKSKASAALCIHGSPRVIGYQEMVINSPYSFKSFLSAPDIIKDHKVIEKDRP